MRRVSAPRPGAPTGRRFQSTAPGLAPGVFTGFGGKALLTAAGAGGRIAPMNAAERRVRTMELLEAAGQALIREAADLTAAGVDTSKLTGPLIGMQEALGELQALDVEAKRMRGLVEPAN